MDERRTGSAEHPDDRARERHRKLPTSTRARTAVLAFMVAALLVSRDVQGCACGCSVFDVGAGQLMPWDTPSGFSLYFRYSYMNQNQNWEGTSKAPASDNADKEIRTRFYTFGATYQIDRSWAVMAELPVYDRSFTSTDDGTVFGPAGSIYTSNITDLGDFELLALYTGLAPDMSTGFGLGVKLPTGNYTGPVGPLGGAAYDRDTLPGTGSTDYVLSAYHVGGLNKDGSLAYFVHAKFQYAFLTRNAYRPGNELDLAAGVYWTSGSSANSARFVPSFEVIGSLRGRDSGANANPENTGFKRILVAPGLEIRFSKVRLYADVEFPVCQDVNAASSPDAVGTAGQLVASVLFKALISYGF